MVDRGAIWQVFSNKSALQVFQDSQDCFLGWIEHGLDQQEASRAINPAEAITNWNSKSGIWDLTQLILQGIVAGLHTPEYVCEIFIPKPHLPDTIPGSQIILLGWYPTICQLRFYPALIVTAMLDGAVQCCSTHPINMLKFTDFCLLNSHCWKHSTHFNTRHINTLTSSWCCWCWWNSQISITWLDYKIPFCSGQPLWFCRENSRWYFKKLYFNIT